MSDKPVAQVQREEYHIAFHTNSSSTVEPNMPIPMGWLKAVKVTIEYDMLPPEHGELAARYNVALVEHPLFPDLERYVFNNGIKAALPKVKSVERFAGNARKVLVEFQKAPSQDDIAYLRECLMGRQS